MSSSSDRMERSTRILWVTKGLGRGGAERLLVGLAKRFDRSYFELEVAYVLPGKDALVPELEALHVPVHCLGGSAQFDLRWVCRLRRLVRRGRFDLVHTHMPYVALGARKMRRARIVHTEHNTWATYRPLMRWANRVTYPRNTAVIAVSHAVADSIHPIPLARRWPPVHVIYHGSEQLASSASTADARTHARAVMGVPEGAFVIGTVGNFTPKKDHETLLKATARVAERHDALRLVLVGSGPLEGALHKSTRDLGLDELVVFAGSRDDVAGLIPAFDVFALSSRHEGLPIALLEAMGSGIPCVATAVGGVPEVVTDGREGLLVPPRDPTALATALSAMLSAPKVREAAGRHATRTARCFDITQAARQTEDLYRDALGVSALEAPGANRG
jgi:glycosyltransferase involved in cell wall biosynthesis